MTPSPLRFCSIPSIAISLLACAPTPESYQAQNLSAKPYNQLELSGNTCGPTALLNSSRFGSSKWQIISNSPREINDRERIRNITFGPAMRPSSSLSGRTRWNRKGINLSDLCDVANEIAKPHNLPTIRQETLFIHPNESQQSHIRRIHNHLAESLAAGFPPILSIRRYVKRNGQWISIDGHFITITSLPGKIPFNADSFDVSYIDPWGGKHAQGKIIIRKEPFLGDKSPVLEAIFSNANVGKRLVRSGENTLITIAASLTAH